MAKIKLITMQGYGTEANPYIGGSEKVITLAETLAPNEFINAVVMFDFDEDPDGSRQASDDMDPVVRTSHINNLVARVLKHIDATFADKVQRKAMRDLLMSECWGWYTGLTSDTVREAWRKDKFPKYAAAFDEIDPAREVK